MTHKLIGYGAFTFASVQFVTGWLRGTKVGPTAPSMDGSLFGDNYNMTLRRRALELIHKINGLLAVMTGSFSTGKDNSGRSHTYSR